uniref:Calpain-A n=1 Tax=Lygus hesperus TaxID=30085 RepID=A0A0A9WPX4_LYGHE
MKILKIAEDYHKAKYECIHTFQLYEDPDFKADDGSLFYSVNHKKNIVWKRPKEIVSDPLMFHDKDVLCRVEHGPFSNCWIVAAMDTLAQSPTLLYNAVPVDQNFTHDYVGIFRFRICRFGKWYEVTIDDKLPYDVEADTLYCMRSKQHDFWAPLLEKAYAKVLGKYEELKYVMSNDAMEEFTSGLCEMYSMATAPELIYYIIRAAMKSKSFLLAYRNDKGRQHSSKYPWVHVFVRDMQKLEKPPPKAKLNVWSFFVRVKATIPMYFETKEEDNMYHKSLADRSMMEYYDLTPVEGEDWVVFGSFIKLFSFLGVVDLPSSNLSPVSGIGGVGQEIKEYHGKWIPDVNAGGSLEEPTFATNPRHFFTLEDPDEGYHNTQTVVISLLQKDRKYVMHSMHKKMQQIGYFIYALPDSPFWSGRINWLKPAGFSRHYAVQEVTKRFRMSLGTYLVVPCTYKAGREGSYILRILTEKRDLTFRQHAYRKTKAALYTVAHTFYVLIYYASILAGWALASVALYLLGFLIFKMSKRRYEDIIRKNK